MSNVVLESQGRVVTNGLSLYYEAFGNPTDPAVLLIMGLASQCLQWFPYFYEPIVEQGYYVIRFDNRDIGLSDWIDHDDWQNHPYDLEVIAQDAVGLLDALKITSAHIIGVSMGGMIAQRMAISYPSRVRSLTSMLSVADANSLKFNLSLLSTFDQSQMRSLEMQLQFWSMLAGSRYPFNEQRYRDLYHEGFTVRQGYNPHCLTHHLVAIHRSGSRLKELQQIQAPTLVVHGTEDPLIMESTALTYSKKIPQAKYLALEGVGHEIPEPISSTVLAAIFHLFQETNHNV